MSELTNTPLTTTQRFWRLLKPDRYEIRNVYIYAAFAGLISLSLPLGIQAIVNLIQGGQINSSWILLVTFVVLGVGLTGLLQIFQLRITENLQQRIFTRSAFEFAYRIPRIKMEELYKHFAPELMNRFFDTVSVQKGLSKILIDFSTAAIYVIFGLTLLSFYHPFFIIFSLLLVLLIFAIFRFTAIRGLATSLDESKFKYKVAHWLEELARTSITFRLGGNTDLPLRRTDEFVGQYLKSRESHFRILIRQYSLMVMFKVVVAAGLLALGGILVMQQRMNIGQFVAAEIIILSVLSSVEKLILSLETIYDVLTGLEKIAQVTDMDLEPTDGMDIREYCPTGGITVAMNDITFAYPGSKRPTLSEISFTANEGERVLIHGQTGSGKSTLLHLLAGLYNVQQGVITYNGLGTEALQLHSVRSAIGELLDQGYIFEGTIAENISLGRNVNFADVKRTAELVKLSDYINTLPMGYSTPLNPQEERLSRSVRQKILLARSIVHTPKLVLLDNPQHYLDPVEFREIIEALTAKERGWTIIVSSSELTHKDLFDKVVELEQVNQGSIAESSFQTFKN